MTAHRCAGGLKKKYDLRSGSQRHRHFVGFFNVPVLAPTRDQPFYTVIDTPPHLVAFYDHAGDTEVHILDLTPGPSRGIRNSRPVVRIGGFYIVNFVIYGFFCNFISSLVSFNSNMTILKILFGIARLNWLSMLKNVYKSRNIKNPP